MPVLALPSTAAKLWNSWLSSDVARSTSCLLDHPAFAVSFIMDDKVRDRRVWMTSLRCCNSGFSVGMQLAIRPKFISNLVLGQD